MRSMEKGLVLKKKIYKGIEITLEARQMKSLRLVYQDGGFILRYPKALPLRRLDAYLEQWEPWMREMLVEKPPHDYDHGDTFLLFGKKVEFERKVAKNIFCQLKEKLYLYCPENTSLEKRQKAIENTFRLLLQERVEKILPDVEKATGLSFKEVKIRKMKNWARCQVKAETLGLSLKSIALDDQLFHVLLLHELLHLRIPNHSREFYEMMEIYLPGARKLNQRIRVHTGY